MSNKILQTFLLVIVTAWFSFAGLAASRCERGAQEAGPNAPVRAQWW
jgi:hypothetical protein